MTEPEPPVLPAASASSPQGLSPTTKPTRVGASVVTYMSDRSSRPSALSATRNSQPSCAAKKGSACQ